MNGNCHFVFGAAVGTALMLASEQISTILPNVSFSPESATLLIMGGIIGGVLPDIDNPTSHIAKLTVPVSTVFGTMGKLTGKTKARHRGIMHDPLVWLLGIVLSYFYFTPLIGLFVGGLSHLWLDLFNPSGIPFLFGVKHLHLGKIESGSTESVMFTWISAILAVGAAVFVKYYFQI